MAFAVILQGQALRVSDEISNSASALLSRKSYFTGKPCRLQSHPLLIAKVSFIPSNHRSTRTLSHSCRRRNRSSSGWVHMDRNRPVVVCMLPFTPSTTFFLRNIFFAIKPDPFRRTKQYRGVAPNNTIASLQTEPLISPNLTHRIIYSDQLSLIIYNSLITPICTCQKLQIIRSLVGVFRSFSKINRNHYKNR